MYLPFMIFPGADFSTFTSEDGQSDLDLSFTPIYGGQVVAETVARLLLSPPGSYDDPSAGIDLRGLCNASLTPSGLNGVAEAIRAQAAAVEGCDDANVEVFQVNGTLFVSLTLELTDGTLWRMAFQLAPDNFSRVWITGADAALAPG
jgi:hypothetical protein